MKATDKSFIYKENEVKVVHNPENTNNVKRISSFFLVFVAMLFFATSSGGITGSAIAEQSVEFTFFPIAMGFVSLVAAFLTYSLIQK